MANGKHYTQAALTGAKDGVKAEWARTNTLGGVVEYAFLPKEARAVYAASRVGYAVTKGAVVGVRTARTELAAQEMGLPLRSVPESEAPDAKGTKGA